MDKSLDFAVKNHPLRDKLRYLAQWSYHFMEKDFPHLFEEWKMMRKKIKLADDSYRTPFEVFIRFDNPIPLSQDDAFNDVCWLAYRWSEEIKK